MTAPLTTLSPTRRSTRARPAAALLCAALVVGTVAITAPAATASPTVSPAAVTATATRGAVLQNAASYAGAHGYTVGIAVYDTVDKTIVGKNSTGTFASESVVKTMIATRLLLQGRMHGSTATRAYKMITQSDDAIASSFYGSVGGDHLITWIKKYYKVPDLGSVPRRPYWWGSTRITAAGLVKFYAKVKADKRVGPWLLNAMHHARSHGSDGVYQFFGLPSATKGAAVKQGWGADYDYAHPTADYNTTGFVNGDRYAVAILGRGPLGTYGSLIGSMLTQVARRVLPGGAFPDPAPTISAVSLTHGLISGGRRMTIHGADFTHVTAVRFGSAAGVTVRTLSSHTIQVTTPRSAAGRVSIRVDTTHGSSGGATFTFGLAPALTTLSTTSGPATGGSTVIVRGTNLSGATNAYFGTVPARIVHVTGTAVQVVAPAHVARAAAVRIRTPYGISPSTSAAVFGYTAPPVATEQRAVPRR